MRFPSWLRKRPAFLAARATFRPRLEALEDRWLPSTLTVTNSFDSGAGSLRAEIAAAHNGDTINFAPSLVGQTITLTSGELLIKKSVTINGPGTSQLTISGDNLSRVFELSNLTKPQVTLSGLTISNGNGVFAAGSSQTNNGKGGAILNDGTLTVSNCILSGNTAVQGGGIYNDQDGSLLIIGSTVSNNSCPATGAFGGGIENFYGTLTVSNSTVSGNFAAGAGGGIYEHSGTVSSSSSSVSGNSAGWGAAIDVDSGSAQVNNCKLNSNFAKVIGGAIYISNVSGTTVTVSGSTLSGNSANVGGGIANDGTLSVTNCTLSNNSASNGGGIFNRYGSLTLSGSTLTGNSATNAGGGIYIYGGANSGTVTVENSSEVINNTAPAGFGADVYNLGTLHLDGSSTIGVIVGNLPS
jgi:hypothetical protein